MTDTELEDQLVAMLRRRASDITAAPPFRAEPVGQQRLRQRLVPLAVAAVAAAVVLIAGGTVVGIRSIHHRTPAGATHTPPPTTPSPSPSANAACTLAMPASWQRAITDGAIPLDHPFNEVISVRPGTGEYLVRQLNSQPTSSGLTGQVTLALFDGKTGQDIAVSDPGTEPLADGSAAISADWITYGLKAPGGNSGYRKVMLYDRHTRQSRTLDQLTAASGDQFLGGPVLFGGQVYWLEVNFAANRSMVKSYDLAGGGTGSLTIPNSADGLIYYGTGLALDQPMGDGAAVVALDGTRLPSSVMTAAGSSEAGYFTFDGSTLRWWTFGDATVLHAYRPGSATIDSEPIGSGVDAGSLTGVSTWPFAVTDFASPAPQILDLRAHVLLSPPRGTNVQAVLGDRALIGTGADQVNGGLSLVRLADLPPAHC